MTLTQTPAAGLTPRPAAGTNWQERGLCRQVDPELFFPELGRGLSSAAKAVCLGCEVRSECLEYALAHGERGIWGSTDEGQRRAIRRTRCSRPAPVADPKRNRDQQILQLTRAEVSAAEIADRLGCSDRTVRRVRKTDRQEAA